MVRSISGVGRQGFGWLGAVGCVALLLQGWLVWRTPVPSLDAVRFTRSAAMIDQYGLTASLRNLQEAPLWIVWVWVVHRVVAAVWGEVPWVWGASVHLSAMLPLLAAFWLVSLLAIRVWGKRQGILASLLFCTLPEVARLGVDGLSDALHLALAAGCVLALLEGLRRFGRKTALFWFVAGGITCGLTCLVRAEVLVVPAAWIGTCLFMFWDQKGRHAAGQVLIAAAVFFLGLAGVWASYAQVSSMSSFSVLGLRWSGFGVAVQPNALASQDAQTEIAQAGEQSDTCAQEKTAESSLGWVLADGSTPSFEAKDPTVSIRRRGLMPALLRTLHKTADVWGYWVGGLALLGLWHWYGREVRRTRLLNPENMFLGLIAGLIFVGAIGFAAWVGYLEARHLVLMVVCGIGAAGAGADRIGHWLRKRFRPRPISLPGYRSASALASTGRETFVQFPARWHWIAAGAWLRILPVGAAVVGSCLAQVGGVHGTRLGHRQAGDYLAHQASSQALVVDTRGWTGLYSGRNTYLYSEAPGVLVDPRLEYFVVESAELAYTSRRAQTLRLLLDIAGTRIAVFPSPEEKAAGVALVELYRWDAERFQAWCVQQAMAQEL